MDVLQTQKQKRKLYKYRQVTLGRVLKGLREERHLKQSDIALIVGIGQSDVSKLESGERSIKFVEIDVYAYALGMSVGEFVKQILEVMLLADDGMPPNKPSD